MSDTPSDDQNEKRDSERRDGAGGSRRNGAGGSGGSSGSRDRRDDHGRTPSGRDGARSGAPRGGDRQGGSRDGQGSGDRRGGYTSDGQGSGDRRAGQSRDGQSSGGSRGGYSRDGQSSGGSRGGYSRDGQSSAGSRGGYSRDGQGAGGRGGAVSRDGQRGGRPGGERPAGRGGRDDRDKKLWTREGRPARGDRDARDQERELTEEERMARELRSVRPHHDDPEVPDDVEPRDLDKGARLELKTLSKENAEWVARHLVMAARLIDENPELAHLHALSAGRRAGRIGVVRETLAITAYATGDFALALRELRTYRRISGSNDQLPLMVDSERGVGRADRALELGRSVDRATLPNDVQVSLAIAMSGARLDLGQNEAALAELEIPQLDPNRAYSWSPDLFHAYADVLEELGRAEQASTWRDRAERAEEVIGASLSVDEHETVDIVEEEFEMFDVDGEDSIAIVDAGEADPDAEAVIEIEDDEDDDGTVPTER